MKKALFLLIIGLNTLSCRDAERWIRRLNFNAIRPPSNLLSPGAIVMRKHMGNVRLLCTAEESLGKDFVPSQSRTVGGRMSSSRKLGWHLSGDAMEQVKVSAKNDQISDVHIQISNATIQNLTDVDVLLNVRYRSAACAAAMRRRLADGWSVSMVNSALRADVTFGVKFGNEGQLSASAKLAQLEAISVSLGGQFDSMTENSGFARALAWGFRDDEALARIGASDADVQALRGQSPVPTHRRSIFLPEESLVAPTVDKLAQTDDDDSGPSWGVTTNAAAADPVPGFDDAVKDAGVQDERQKDDGFVPTRDADVDTEASDEVTQDPGRAVNPRSRRMPIGDVLDVEPQG